MTWRLSLYVTGDGWQSRRAIENANEICRSSLDEPYELEVIDVLAHPSLAERDKILATPTLVRREPLPSRKIIGDLSDREKALHGLDLPWAKPKRRGDGT